MSSIVPAPDLLSQLKSMSKLTLALSEQLGPWSGPVRDLFSQPVSLSAPVLCLSEWQTF